MSLINFRKYLIFIFIISFLFSCDYFRPNNSNKCNKYELLKVDKDIAYRINKETGEVYFITPIESKKIISNEESTVDLSDDILKVKNWGKKTIPNFKDVELELETKWKDGKLFYRFFAGPIKRIEQLRGPYTKQWFTIIFQDKDNFELFKKTVYVDDMYSQVDYKGEREKYSIEGSISCSIEDFKEITAWSYSWSL